MDKVVIIGSGPAGWSAGIYCGRASLGPILYEGEVGSHQLPGGQLMLTTDVENYPGFEEGVTGPELMEKMRKQSERFGVRVRSGGIKSLDLKGDWIELEDQNGEKIETRSVIIATGASANWLGLESEERLVKNGGGVSACAVCDGALPYFRGKDLGVVGGGDTAMEEALYLSKFANRVYVFHRRDKLRASQVMQSRAMKNEKIEFKWNQEVIEVLGEEKIRGVRLKDRKEDREWEFEIGGLFIAIGHSPNTDFLKGKIELDENGYIEIKEKFRTKTSMEGVFAAGDVMDSYYRQAITAAGTGCMAALDAERWLSEKEYI